MSAPPSGQIAALLGQAVQAMRLGQPAAAEAVLRRVLTLARNEPDALQLLGLVCAEQGRLAEAETQYRQSLAQRPKQPHVQTNLGKLLAATGRHEEAIGLLRAAVRAKPDLFDAVLTLGHAQKAVGDAVNAEKSLRAALKLQPDALPALMELSELLTDRPQDDEAVLRTALKQVPPGSPLRAVVEHNLAVAVKRQRRYAEALPLFDTALARAPDMPMGTFNRANTLAQLGRNDEAIAAYRDFLAREPMSAAGHQELNALLYRLGRDGEFLGSYDDALERGAQPGALLLQKGNFLVSADRLEDARACFSRAVALSPGDAEARNGLALVLTRLGEYDGAIAAYGESLARNPDDHAARTNLAVTLLRVRDARKALELTEDAVRRAPFDQGALAVHELALRANDDPRGEALADYGRHVRVFDLDPPPGFASMQDFQAALNAWLDTLHTDRREPVDQTLRRGTQTPDSLFDRGNPLIDALRLQIEGALSDYIAGLSDGAAHPLAGRRTRGFRFAGSWSSRLGDNGFHTNHIHPQGWISSCYYIAVPDVAQDAAAKQGWIKFGEPSFDAALRDPIRRTVQPVPGRLVLFPSYMWHGTVPFHAPTARTTIAFDAIPA